MILRLFLWNSSPLIDWGWLSLGSAERWVMNKSCLAQLLGNLSSILTTRLLFPIFWHTCPLRFLCSRCYILLITKLFKSLCVEFWHILLLSLFHSLTVGSLSHSEGRWQTMEMAHQHVSPLITFPPTLLQCETGTPRGHSHLFRGMESHAPNGRIAGCSFLNRDAHFMFIGSNAQFWGWGLRINKVRINNNEK